MSRKTKLILSAIGLIIGCVALTAVAQQIRTSPLPATDAASEATGGTEPVVEDGRETSLEPDASGAVDVRDGSGTHPGSNADHETVADAVSERSQADSDRSLAMAAQFGAGAAPTPRSRPAADSGGPRRAVPGQGRNTAAERAPVGDSPRQDVRGAGRPTSPQRTRSDRAEGSPRRASALPSALTGQQSANVSVEIIGPPGASAGVPADYELVVRNQGNNAVENVRVEAELPEGCEFVSATPPAAIDTGTASWALNSLDPGVERRINMQLRPLGEGTLQCHAMVTCTALSGVQTVVTRPQLALTMSAPREIVIGQAVTFTLTVSNPGTGTATNVLVRSLVPAGLAHSFGDDDELEYEVGTLGPGESREVQLDLTAREAGSQTNQAEVTADGGLRAAAEAAVRVLQPQLKLTKTGPKRRYLERPATYSLVVSNPGTFTAANVAVVDEVPDGFVFVEASDGGRLSPDKRTVRWTIGQLDAGSSRPMTVTLRPTTPGEFCAASLATADGNLRAETEACTAVEGICALFVELVDLADPIEVGAETTYEIRVVNQGSQAATNVVIRALAPSGMRPVDADGPTAFQIRGQDVIFEPLPRLGIRADAAYHIHVRGDRAGDLRFRVTLQCDQLEAAVNKEESTRVFADE